MRSIKNRVQVAVIGAGPAGSTAAEAAASNGADVFLIDRKEEIGTPVQCGGFLPETHELVALMPGAALPPALADLPDRCVLQRTKFQRFFSPSGNSKEFPVDGRVVDRRALDRHLVYRAARAGATVLPATKAQPVGGGVELSGRHSGSIRPEVIIGADGPSSATARSIGSGLTEVGVCMEYEMADVDIDGKAAEMYFGTRFAPGGYAWIIPLASDIANVGIGVRPSYVPGTRRLPEILDHFVLHHPTAGEMLRRGEVTAVMRGIVPAGGMPPVIQRENVLLAGDAAGQVMATSGGGIPLAMVAGTIAGSLAADHLAGEADLDSYPKLIDEAFGRQLARSVKIRRLVDVVMHSDRMMDALVSMLYPDQMKAIQRGQIPGGLPGILRSIAGK